MEAAVGQRFEALASTLDERLRRLRPAGEAKGLGYSGVTVVAAATGITRRAIHAALRQLTDAVAVAPLERARRLGGTCCGMSIGLLRSVKLNKDGQGVTAIACIEKEYADLVYKAGGVHERQVVQFGISAFKGGVDLQALGGGIELAVSPKPAQRAPDWQPQFDLAEAP
jgi:hypothetical protein